jgi:NADH-quinone oxidoreductase subunit C
VDNEHALAVARFLRDDPALRLDYASNVTGIDWLDSVTKEITKTKQVIEGVEREIEQTTETKRPGYLEAVYHLYSMELKHGPVILRLRTGNRTDQVHLPSLTPIWRGAEFQEREIFDLYGIVFDGHPDLRRILMWETYAEGNPLRKSFPLRGRFSRAEQVRQALNANPEAHYSMEELSIAEGAGDLPEDMRERLKRGERGVIPDPPLGQ